MNEGQKREEKMTQNQTYGLAPDKKSSKGHSRFIGIIAAAAVLIAVLIGVGIYNTPANRMSRHLDLGARYLEEQNYEQAVVEFDQVIAIDPMSVDAYLGKAQAYEGMGDTEKTIETLQTGYEKTGEEQIQEIWLSSQLGLAQKYLEEENYEQAIIEFDKAIAIDPMNADAYLDKAQAYKKMGDTEKARQTLIEGYEKTKDVRFKEALEQLDIIKWEDSAVEKAVRYELGKPEGDIHINEVAGITYLFISDPDNLNDLKYLTNLDNLHVEGGNIHTADALRGLTKLKYLDLVNCNLVDISALRELSDLEMLNLYQNNISDIDALSGLTNLEMLGLEQNNISDVDALSGLIKLETLSLWQNNISDISALGELINMHDLHLSQNSISDIDALKSLTNLVILELDENNVSDISVLGNLPRLGFVDLRDNPIKDYSPISAVDVVYTE